MTQRRRVAAERAVVGAALDAREELGVAYSTYLNVDGVRDEGNHRLFHLYEAVKALAELPKRSIDDPAPSAGDHTSPITSRQAATAILPVHGSIRRRIYDYLLEHSIWGGTDQEIEHALHIPHTTESSARNSLMCDGWVQDTGRKRTTLAGRDAIVWWAVPE